MKIVDVRKIWDQAPHNAFTDLVHFEGRFFCVFREGEGHVSPDGALRVIASSDGVDWASAALITSDHSDLRDAKITVTPEGQLMLCGAEALHDRSVHTHQSLAWFSSEGAHWSERVEIGDPDVWLWRVTWHRSVAYGMGYGCGESSRRLRFYRSEDGRQFRALGDYFTDGDYANETSIVFVGDTAHCSAAARRRGCHGDDWHSGPTIQPLVVERFRSLLRRPAHAVPARWSTCSCGAHPLWCRRSAAHRAGRSRPARRLVQRGASAAIGRRYQLCGYGAARRNAVGQLLFFA